MIRPFFNHRIRDPDSWTWPPERTCAGKARATFGSLPDRPVRRRAGEPENPKEYSRAVTTIAPKNVELLPHLLAIPCATDVDSVAHRLQEAVFALRGWPAETWLAATDGVQRKWMRVGRPTPVGADIVDGEPGEPAARAMELFRERIVANHEQASREAVPVLPPASLFLSEDEWQGKVAAHASLALSALPSPRPTIVSPAL